MKVLKEEMFRLPRVLHVSSIHGTIVKFFSDSGNGFIEAANVKYPFRIHSCQLEGEGETTTLRTVKVGQPVVFKNSAGGTAVEVSAPGGGPIICGEMGVSVEAQFVRWASQLSRQRQAPIQSRAFIEKSSHGAPLRDTIPMDD